MNRQKGISTLLIIIIVVSLIIVVIGGLFVYQYLAMQQTQPTACTKEAKVCPDGSTVGRTGSNCEFASCPTGISADSLKNVTLSYPNPYDVSKNDTINLVNGHALLSDAGNIKPRVYDITTTAVGDLDGDNIQEGVIGIYQGYGANIIVPIVFVFSNKNGVLTQIDSVLPDTSDWNYETQIKSLSIDNNILSANILVLAEKDKSLPHYQQQASVEKNVQYKLIDGKLIIQSDQTAGWKTYTNNQYGFTFNYPQNLSVTEANDVIANRVVISHSVVYKHNDPCDFVGDSPQLEKLTDFYIWINLLSGSNIEDVISDNSMPGYSLPKQKVTIGGFSGYKYTIGAEMCGMDYYYLAITPKKTLWIGSPIITELSSILPKEEVNKYLAIPGIISATENEALLNKIISTFKLTK